MADFFCCTIPTAVQSFGMQDAIRHIENHILWIWITMQNWAKQEKWSSYFIIFCLVSHPVLFFNHKALKPHHMQAPTYQWWESSLSNCYHHPRRRFGDKWPDARNLTVHSTDALQSKSFACSFGNCEFYPFCSPLEITGAAEVLSTL